MTGERYTFLGFPVPLSMARQMADQLTFHDSAAPVGAQHVIRRRTQYVVPARRAA